MKNGIENIFVAWRRSNNSQQFIVGVIEYNKTDGASFHYLPEGVRQAELDGFTRYTEFPDLEVVYQNNVLDIFGHRLNNPERADIQKYYDFWEIETKNKDDKYYLLAHTQGITPTDNFEFLADYTPFSDLSFVSEACGLSALRLPLGIIQKGDVLSWEKEPNKDSDQYAVMLFKDDVFIGTVKAVHSRCFYKPGGNNLKVVVKSISSNGTINRVFIKVFYDANPLPETHLALKPSLQGLNA